MLALAVTVFPINTHLAAYATFWGSVLLLLAALYAGSLLGSGVSALTKPELDALLDAVKPYIPAAKLRGV